MKKKVSVVVLVILTLLLAILLLVNRQQEQSQTAHLQRLRKEAAPYEQEIRDIRSDLKDKYRALHYDFGTAGTAFGFVLTSAEEIEIVKETVKEYTFTPTIILDCSLDQNTLENIVQKASYEGYDVLLAGMTWNAEVLETADAIKAILPQYGYDQTPAFFLRRTADTEENRNWLQQHGYQHLVRYSDTLQSMMITAENVSLSYGFIRSEAACSNFIQLVLSGRAITLMSMDFADLRNGTMTKQTIENCLRQVYACISKGSMRELKLEDAFRLVVEDEIQLQRAKEEYELYEKQQKDRIEELENIIDEIYSHWND